MKTFRHEIESVVLVMAMPIVLSLIFPYSAIGFKARTGNNRSVASSAFVILTEEEEHEAMRSASSAWSSTFESDRYLYAYLPLGDLPESMGNLTIGDIKFDFSDKRIFDVEFRPGGWMPSQRASAPKHLSVVPLVGQKKAFSRRQLLNLEP